MSAPKNPVVQRDAVAAVRATDAIRRLGQKPEEKPSTIKEDLQKAAPKPSKVPTGLVAGALVVLILVSSLGGVYLAGRLNPSVQKKLAAIPVVGRYLFPEAAPAPTTPAGTEPSPSAPSTIPTPAVPGSQISLALKALQDAEKKFGDEQKAFQANQEKLKKEQATLDQSKKDFEAQKKAWQDQLFNLDKQVQILSQMKPATAAQMLDGMADDTVVQILAKMKEADTARLLGAMDPFHAARLYERLNGQPAAQPAPAAPELTPPPASPGA